MLDATTSSGGDPYHKVGTYHRWYRDVERHSGTTREKQSSFDIQPVVVTACRLTTGRIGTGIATEEADSGT